MQSMLKSCLGLPLAQQKNIIHKYHEEQFRTSTGILSNLGLIILPPSITDKVKNMEFSISQDGNPYTYAVITVNKTMTMTITSSVEGFAIENAIKRRFEEAWTKVCV